MGSRTDSTGRLAEALEEVRSRLNRRCYVHPDPLEFLYAYEDPGDREIAGLVASSLAIGRVGQILKSVSAVLGSMGRPRRFLLSATDARIEALFRGFRHRFATGKDLSAALRAAKRAIGDFGSLKSFFLGGCPAEAPNLLPALRAFAAGLLEYSGSARNALLPDPDAGSAMKRINLYLRWMVRSDEVDPGGWDRVPRSKLIVPLDTHMHRMGRLMGFTRRSQADMRTALEITAGFALIAPDDPVKYDFPLTRLGIRGDCSALLERFSACARATCKSPRRPR